MYKYDLSKKYRDESVSQFIRRVNMESRRESRMDGLLIDLMGISLFIVAILAAAIASG